MTELIYQDLVTAIIDLNIRVRGRQTLVGIEDCDGPVAVGQLVRLLEQESGIHGFGEVTDVDREKRLVYLSVPWQDLQLPEGKDHG